MNGNKGFDEKKQLKDSPSRFGNVQRWRHEYKYMIDAKQESILRIKHHAYYQEIRMLGKMEHT